MEPAKREARSGIYGIGRLTIQEVFHPGFRPLKRYATQHLLNPLPLRESLGIENLPDRSSPRFQQYRGSRWRILNGHLGHERGRLNRRYIDLNESLPSSETHHTGNTRVKRSANSKYEIHLAPHGARGSAAPGGSERSSLLFDRAYRSLSRCKSPPIICDCSSSSSTSFVGVHSESDTGIPPHLGQSRCDSQRPDGTL